MIHPLIEEKKDCVILRHPEQIPGGTIPAIPSKSHAHRLLIAASLSDTCQEIICPSTSKDIDATAECLRQIGIRIQKKDRGFLIDGIRRKETGLREPLSQGNDVSSGPAVLHVGESGSTLRFLLPVLGALGIPADLHMEGRLPGRPLSPLYEELTAHGMTLSPQGSNPLHVTGQLHAGEYRIDGGVSSQYITGLLFALPLLNEDSRLVITGHLESRPYVNITLGVLKTFGIKIRETLHPEDGIATVFDIPGGGHFHCPSNGARSDGNSMVPRLIVEGDWSNAAFFLAAGALLDSPVTVTGCDPASPQGDKAILQILREFGAEVRIQETAPAPGDAAASSDRRHTAITVSGGPLHGINIDAADIPDLVPVLSVIAACAEGTTVIRNIQRLRIKESDRVATVTEMLTALGTDCSSTQSELRIEGQRSLSGGSVSSHNDHRIAMAAAIASLRATGPVEIRDPMAVNKSYPGFYEDLAKLFGGSC